VENLTTRREKIRIPDLYRVNDGLTSSFNNLHDTGRTLFMAVQMFG
jgi:hypothetical protein